MSSTREALAGYVEGRVRAERLVAAAAAAYYRDRRGLTGDGWRELMAVIERGSPGIVELVAADGKGFEITLAERPFPPQFEAALKAAAQKALVETPDARTVPSRGFFGRIVDRVLQIFR